MEAQTVAAGMLIDQADEAVSKEIAECVSADLKARMPELYHPDFPEGPRDNVIACMINAFYNGARWAEEAINQRESLTINDKGQLVEKKKLIVGL